MNKTRLPYLPLYAGDFLRSTMGWTLAERGTYLLLLMSQWEVGALPNDKDRLAMMAGITPGELDMVWSTVGPKFQETPQGLVNLRMEEHRAAAVARHESYRQRGSAGGRKRRENAAVAKGNPEAPKRDPLPYESPEFHRQVVGLYNKICTALAPIKNWPEHRARALNGLIATTMECAQPMDKLENWRWYFDGVARTSFLTGSSESGWRADIDWLLTPAHFCKVVEGGYEPADCSEPPPHDFPDARELTAKRDRFKSA